MGLEKRQGISALQRLYKTKARQVLQSNEAANTPDVISMFDFSFHARQDIERIAILPVRAVPGKLEWIGR